MFAHDARVADLLITKRQLVVRESDGPGFVRELRVFQRARMKRDRPRLFPACERDTAMEPPQRRKPSVGNPILQRIWRSPKRRCSLAEVVLKQPCFGEGGPDEQLVFPWK